MSALGQPWARLEISTIVPNLKKEWRQRMEKSFFLFCFTDKKPNDTLRTKFSTQAEYYQQLFF